MLSLLSSLAAESTHTLLSRTRTQGLVAASSKISEQEALYHARLTPITDRLVGMAFPEPLDAVSRLLGTRYQVPYDERSVAIFVYLFAPREGQRRSFFCPCSCCAG